MSEIEMTVSGLYNGYNVSVKFSGERDLLFEKLPSITEWLSERGVTPSANIKPLAPEDKYRETIYDGEGAKLVCTWNGIKNEKMYLVKIGPFQKYGIAVYEEIIKFFRELNINSMEVGQEVSLSNYKVKVLMSLSEDKTEYKPYKCIDIKAK